MMFPNIHSILRILLTYPVTICECERSISVLNRVKTFNRTTQTDERLTGLCIICAYRETPINWEKVVNTFAGAPILKYPNPHKRYVVFTDASDQAAAAVLTEEYSDENAEVKEMPIAYLSAQFPGTQFNWSTIVKEGYAIYYAIKKWRHYLDDADILLKSDAKPLEKFLHGRTDNHKLDRWSLELQGRNIKVEHIPGHKTRLLIVCPDYLLSQEKEIVIPLRMKSP